MKTLRMLTVLSTLVAGVCEVDAKTRRYADAYACRHHKRWTHNEVRCAISRVWAHSPGRRGALRVAECESGFNAYEVTGIYKGVFQIGPRWMHPDAPRNLFDPVVSAAWTRQITRDGRRWRDWQCGWAAR